MEHRNRLWSIHGGWTCSKIQWAACYVMLCSASHVLLKNKLTALVRCTSYLLFFRYLQRAVLFSWTYSVLSCFLKKEGIVIRAPLFPSIRSISMSLSFKSLGGNCNSSSYSFSIFWVIGMTPSLYQNHVKCYQTI